MPTLDVEEEQQERRELGSMSLLQHLEELRKRIINSVVAVAVGFFVAFWYHDQIYAWMAKPLTEALIKLHQDPTLKYTNPTQPFNIYLKLSLIASIFLTSPIVLYQVWNFISPGLYRKEKRYVVPFLFLTVGLFVSGGVFGYKIVFPVAMEFLIDYAKGMTAMITITEYTSLFLTIILGLAIMFELPIVIGFMALMGVVDAKFLFRHIRGAIFLFFIVAAILTPTTDILNMSIYAAPMIALYILSIGIAWLVHPKQRRLRAEQRESGQQKSGPWTLMIPFILLIGALATVYLHMRPSYSEVAVGIESKSPDGKWIASVMQRKYNRDGSLTAHVNLRSADSSIHRGFFSGIAGEGEVFALQGDAKDLHLGLAWDSATQLTIQCPNCANVNKKDQQWGIVVIKYQSGGR